MKMLMETEGAIVTFSGKIIKPLDPDLNQICIEDIAHALSNSCRFTGHTKFHYSVAQHSYYVSNLVSDEYALDGLLHDASEAYLSDMARPVKSQPGFGEVYREVEDTLMETISKKFGIKWPMPEEVKWADNVLLRSEQRDLMPDLLRLEGDDYTPYMILPWTPTEAKDLFLKRFKELI